MQHRPLVPPALGLAGAVVSVSFAAPLFRLAEAPALTASFWRLAFAVLLLLPFTRGAWQAWRRYDAAAWRVTVLAGVALGLHFALWVTSLFMTTVAASVSLVTLQAVFVALGGRVLGDRLGRQAWAGVLLATFGALVIGADPVRHAVLGAVLDGDTAGLATAFGASRRALVGDLLAVLGGLGSALYMLIGRRLRADRNLVEYVAPVYAVAALTVLLLLPAAGQPLSTGLGPEAFVVFVLLAAIPMLGGHTLANWCFRYMEAHVVATWILLEPVGAALLAWLPPIHEVPGPWTLVGGALVLTGAALTVRPGARARPVFSAD